MKQPTQRAKSTVAQIKQVLMYIHKNGSINRYEADEIGVCQLAARIFELKGKGLIISHIDENVVDFHGTIHPRVRRYSIDWRSMEPKAIEYFKEWLKWAK